MRNSFRHEVLVVGTGAAGLMAAVEAAKTTDVGLVSKELPPFSPSATFQYGLAAALGVEHEDRPEWHAYDTVKAGDGLCNEEAVIVLSEDAPRVVHSLAKIGALFTRSARGYIAQTEGEVHTANFGERLIPRVCWGAENTGRAIISTLYGEALKHGVTFYSEFLPLKLLLRREGVSGLVALELATGELHTLQGKALMIADGGLGGLLPADASPSSCAGEGMALALGAGIPLQDMEYLQLSPLGLRGVKTALSERAREFGAMRNNEGERFMGRYAPTMKERAPCDLAARATQAEIAEGRGIKENDYIHLDLTQVPQQQLKIELPLLRETIRRHFEIDPKRKPIPVCPAYRWCLGGIPTDTEARVLADGERNPIPGLYAAGACASTAVHGANALVSNVLLEALVFGARGGKSMASFVRELEQHYPLPRQPTRSVEDLLGSLREKRRNGATVPALSKELQAIMGAGLLLERSEQSLARAEHGLEDVQNQVATLSLRNGGSRYNTELIMAFELRSRLALSRAIVRSARKREESRGAHVRSDFPTRSDEKWRQHLLAQAGRKRLKITTKPISPASFDVSERIY